MRVLTIVFASAMVSSAALAELVVRKAPEPPAQSEDVMTIAPGFVNVINVDNPYSTIVVGNPDLLDVLVQTDRRFVTQSKKDSGVTNVLVMAETGQQLLNLTVRISNTQTGGTRVLHGNPVATSRARALAESREYRCTERDCTLAVAPTAVEQLPGGVQTITQPLPGGGFITVTAPVR